MSVEEYTENISRIIEKCLALNPEARLIRERERILTKKEKSYSLSVSSMNE